MNETLNPNISFENQIKYLLVFGIIWGIFELIFVPVLKGIFYPLNGFVIPFIIILYLLVVKNYLPTPGTIMLMSIIAATMKFLFVKTELVGSFMAILVEGLIIETVFLIGKYQLSFYLLSGIFVEIYNILHPLISKGIFFEFHQFIAFKRWVAQLIGLGMGGEIARSTIMIILVTLHLSFGSFAGWLAWKIAKKLVSKMNEQTK